MRQNNNLFRSLVLLLVIIVNSINLAVAQNPAYFTIGEDEFTNIDIYSILYNEKNDLLYVGTNTGLYVYKQNKFVALNSCNEQIGNSFFYLQQDHTGQVYCNNLNGQIFKVNNESIELFYQVESKVGTGFWFYILENDNFLIVSSSQIIGLNTNKTVFFSKKKGKAYSGWKYNEPSLANNSIYITFSNELESIVYKFENEELSKIKEVPFKLSQIFKFNDRYINIDHSGDLEYIDNNWKVTKVNPVLPGIYYQTDQSLLVLSSQAGIKEYIVSNDSLIPLPMYFSGKFISTYTKSQNEVVYLGTFGGGVIVIPNTRIKKYTHAGLLLGVASSSNVTMVSTRSGEVLELSKTGLRTIASYPKNIDNIYYTGKSSILETYGEKGFIHNANYDYDFLIGMKNIFPINQNNIIVTYQKNIDWLEVPKNIDGEIKNIKPKISWKININERLANAVWSSTDSLIYYSSNFNLYQNKFHSTNRKKILYKGNSILCNDLKINGEKLTIASTQNGILVYEKGIIKQQLSATDGLLSSNVLQIEFYHHLLFILTKNGFQIYDLTKNAFLDIGIENGILIDKVTKFSIEKNYLTLLEKHAVYQVKINDIIENKSSKYPIKIYIDGITVNNKKINPLEDKKFSHDKNHFIINYDYRHIVSKKESQILYKLEGFYDEWKIAKTNENKIEFQSLPPGQYTFRIKAKYKSNYSEDFIYKFNISFPYWERWWFYALLFLTTALIFIFISRQRALIQKKKNKEILEKEILSKDLAQSKLKAIRSQMNPHFIFNSLNSIQNLVLEQDVDKSYDYIVLFAELVRSALNYSEEEFISIDKELGFLDVYLQLEKLRFGDDFTYTIDYEGSNDVRVPSLVVQPFIENALLHGLLNKKGKKRLAINFELNKVLTCTIIDNGVGREKAAAIKKRNNGHHESFSTKAIKKRMELLSSQLNTEAGFVYEDIISNEEVVGTKVIITMPFQLF